MTRILHERAQRFLVNNAVAAGADITATGRAVMLAIVNGLLGTGSFTDKENAASSWGAPLTCKGSSDSVAANLTGTNLWDSATDLVWAASTSAHSWIVLQHPVLPWEICIDLNSSTIASARILVSPSAGFTGGTTTARPTATDEFNLISAGIGAWGLSLTNVANQWHLIVSDDGKSMRVVITRNGWGCALWAFDVPADPQAGWTDPCACGIVAVSTAAPSSTNLGYAVWAAAVVKGVGLAAAVIDLQYTQDASGSSDGQREGQITAITNLDNAFSSEWALFPIGLVSATASNTGFHGRVPDMYGGPLQVNGGTLVDGSWYGEASGDEEFVQLGAVVLPWPKVAPSFGAGSPVYLGPAYVASAAAQGTPSRYLMQGWDSTDERVTWPVAGEPDFTGASFGGPNTPLTNIAIAGKRTG